MIFSFWCLLIQCTGIIIDFSQCSLWLNSNKTRQCCKLRNFVFLKLRIENSHKHRFIDLITRKSPEYILINNYLMAEYPVHLNLTSGIVHGGSLTDPFNTTCSFHSNSIITPLHNYHTYKSKTLWSEDWHSLYNYWVINSSLLHQRWKMYRIYFRK